MKVACLLAVIVNILLVGVAGYRIYSVPQSEVESYKAALADKLSALAVSQLEAEGISLEELRAEFETQGISFDDLRSDFEGRPRNAAPRERAAPEQNIIDFSDPDALDADHQGDRQRGMDAFRGQVGQTFGVGGDD